MKISIFGIRGQLGVDLEAALSRHEIFGHDVVDIDNTVDVTDREAVITCIDAERPDWVINSAAMTHVDLCESEAIKAYQINALGARYLAEAAADAGAAMVQISTDYVFDGSKTAPYVEDDPTHPINVYGMTKLAGEWFTESECERHYTVRTSGLYGLAPCRGKGTNFVEKMLELAKDRSELTVVNDEVLTPTFTADLAAQVALIVEGDLPPGVYHATNEGQCSWFDFATEIFRMSETPIGLSPISAAEWKAPAKRPAYSVLENAALEREGKNIMPDWADALERYIEQRKAALSG